MRILLMTCLFLICSACVQHSPRCEGHLHAINVHHGVTPSAAPHGGPK